MKYSWGVKEKRRRYIEVWIFFLLLFSVNFFELKPITRVVGPNGGFTFCLLTLFFCFTFNREAWIRDSKGWLKPFWWFLLGVFLSIFTAQAYYGQSPVQSFFTYRRMFQFIAFPIFIAIRPSEQELRSALYAFAVVYLFFVFLVTFMMPGWVDLKDNMELVEKGDYVHKLEGIRILSLAFIFSFCRLVRGYSPRNLFWAVFLFLILFLIQNRTSLVAVIAIALYAIYSMNASPRKLMIITVIGVVLLLMFVYTAGQWGHLYQETIEQILNPDYNRNKAYAYMFASREWPRYIFGDGFISANVSNIIPMLQESGIYFSDVGLIGTWYQFGVITTGTVLVMIGKAFTRRKSFLVKSCAIYLLAGTFTMSYFGMSESLMWLSLYLYVYYSDALPSFRSKN